MKRFWIRTAKILAATTIVTTDARKCQALRQNCRLPKGTKHQQQTLCSASFGTNGSLQFHDLSVLTTLRGGGSDGSKLANLVERIVPAAILLAALACIVKFFGPVGVSCLLQLLSPILYQEACHVVDVATPINNNNRIASTLNAPNAKNENAIVTPLQQHQEPLEPATDATAASALSFSNPWWWFASYSCSLTLPSLLDDSHCHTHIQPDFFFHGYYRLDILCPSMQQHKQQRC
jgi:hypothetical protein